MPRTTGGPSHSRKRKRVLKRAKGFVGGPGTIYRQALEFTRKAGVYATRDRRQRKRHFRTLWITRLSAALCAQGDPLQPVHSRPDCGRNRVESQDAQ